mgnify:CR=1 FL=1
MKLSRAIADFLHERPALEVPLVERKAVALWPEVMGPTIAGLTRSVEMKNGILTVRLNSAALKAELFENRFALVKKMNEALGVPAIHDVRLY